MRVGPEPGGGREQSMNSILQERAQRGKKKQKENKTGTRGGEKKPPKPERVDEGNRQEHPKMQREKKRAWEPER